MIDRTKGAPERKEMIRELAKIRLNEPILYQGKMQWDEYSGSVLKFNRDGKIFCTINMGETETEVTVPAGAEVIYASRNADCKENVVKLPIYGFIAYKTEKE